MTKTNAELKRERRKRLLDGGLCVYCGKRKHIPGRTGCRTCLDEQAEYHRERRKHVKERGSTIYKRFQLTPNFAQRLLNILEGNPDPVTKSILIRRLKRFMKKYPPTDKAGYDSVGRSMAQFKEE